MAAKPSSQRRSAVTGAITSVVIGIAQKFAVFLIAGLAFVFLIGLDRAKTRYDISKDKNNISSFVVKDEFIAALNLSQSRPDVHAWLNDPTYFKYHRFSNQKAFLAALSDRAAVEYVNASASLQADVRDLTHRKEKAQEDQKKLAGAATTWKQKQEEIDNLDAELKPKNEALKKHWETLNNQTSFIHTQLTPQLPQVLLTLGGHSQGFLDPLVDPILNESGSLNIVFQVLRMSALVIIVITFIFIAVAGFQMLPLASGATTVSEQLRSLISVKSVAAGSEVAKAAVIGIAAVSVGTVAVVGVQALQGAGNTPVLARYLPAESGGSGTSSPGFQHPIEFRPNVNVRAPIVNLPAPVVHDRPIVTSDTAQILLQLELLIKALPTAQNVADLKARIELLEKQPKTICCPGPRIFDLDPQPGPNPGPTPDPNPGPSPDPNPGPSPDPSPGASATPSPSLAEALAKLHEELKKANDNDRLRRRPDDRNILVRTSDFIRGAHYFAVTKHSLESLSLAMEPTTLDPKLKAAMEELMLLPPQRKSEFLNSLRVRVRRANAPAALEQLKQYEQKFLIYFKLRN